MPSMCQLRSELGKDFNINNSIAIDYDDLTYQLMQKIRSVLGANCVVLYPWANVTGSGTEANFCNSGTDDATYGSSIVTGDKSQIGLANALTFQDRGSDVNDLVTIADSANLSFTDDANDEEFSIGFWYFHKAVDINETFFVKGGAADYEYRIGTNVGGQPRLFFLDASIPKSCNILASGISGDTWYFLVFTYSPDVGGVGASDNEDVESGMSIFINAVDDTQAGSVATCTNYVAMENGATDVEIGGGVGFSNYLTSKIVAPFIANVQLSPANILSIYNTSKEYLCK